MDAIGFDVYGTLVDPQRMQEHLRAVAGERAGELARSWRQKQLEYSFRRGLMNAWASFETCTADALLFAARECRLSLSEAERSSLLDQYRRLPAYPEASLALTDLRSKGLGVVAFSNGSTGVLRELLGHAGLLQLFDDVISVEEVRTFKPNPAVYERLVKRVGRSPRETWLVSGNPFDVVGAKAAGLRAAWVRRSPEAPFDPWGKEPDLTVADLAELAARLTKS